MADIPQFALPLRLAPNGQLVVLEQDSTPELASRVNVLCRTPPGWLDGRPGMGLADQRFRRGGADTEYIAEQITTWVPDADAIIEADSSQLTRGLDFIGVRIAP